MPELDELEKTISRAPLTKMAVNFVTRRVVANNAGLTIQRTVGYKIFFWGMSLLFVIAGLGIMIAGFFYAEIPWLARIIALIFGSVGLGIFFGEIRRALPIFDLTARAFWQDRRTSQDVIITELNEYTAFSEIAALQIIPNGCQNFKFPPNYELNLVRRNGSRVNLAFHHALALLRADAQKIATAINVPVWETPEIATAAKSPEDPATVKKSRQVMMIIGGGFLLISTPLLYLFGISPYWQSWRAQQWEKVPAEIITNELAAQTTHSSRKRKGTSADYQPRLRFTYTFANGSYIGTQYDFYYSKYWSGNRAEIAGILAQYPVQLKTECWVNPQNPTFAVLTPQLPAKFYWVAALVGLFFITGMVFIIVAWRLKTPAVARE